MHTLHFLVGPSAVGKTELSLQWAEANGAEILSCDAYCVYRGMDIGTAKPTAEDQARVPHHGLDLVPVTEPFSVGRYLEYAREAVADITGRGKRVLVSGGSGFYLKSFFAPVVDRIEIPEAVTKLVEELEKERGLSGLRQALQAANPGVDLEDWLDTNNPRRMSNQLARCLASKRTIPELREEFRKQPTPFDGFERKVCLLSRDRDDLHRRVRQRVAQMLDEGLVEEVQRLKADGLAQNPAAANAIGYRETLEWLIKGGTTEELAEAIAINTDRLIKKQRTWFRSQIPVDQALHLNAEEPGDATGLFERS